MGGGKSKLERKGRKERNREGKWRQGEGSTWRSLTILCHSRQGSRRGHVDRLTLCFSGSTSQSGKGAIVKAFGSIERYPLFWDNGYSQGRLPGGGDICKGL